MTPWREAGKTNVLFSLKKSHMKNYLTWSLATVHTAVGQRNLLSLDCPTVWFKMQLDLVTSVQKTKQKLPDNHQLPAARGCNCALDWCEWMWSIMYVGDSEADSLSLAHLSLFINNIQACTAQPPCTLGSKHSIYASRHKCIRGEEESQPTSETWANKHLNLSSQTKAIARGPQTGLLQSWHWPLSLFEEPHN